MSNIDYTGASAQKYIDSYVNRPQDMGTRAGLTGLLNKMSWVTPVGPSLKGLSLLPFMMKGIKTVKQADKVDDMVRLWRGVPSWLRGDMVRKGMFKGPSHYQDLVRRGGKITDKLKWFKRKPMVFPGGRVSKTLWTGRGGNPNHLYTTIDKKVAIDAAIRSGHGIRVDLQGNPIKRGKTLLEFLVPRKIIKKLSEKGITGSNKEVLFEGGLPKKYLIKVHKLLNKSPY